MNLNGVAEKYAQTIKAIILCGENKCFEPAVRLVYSAIDFLLWLYSDQTDLNKRKVKINKEIFEKVIMKADHYYTPLDQHLFDTWAKKNFSRIEEIKRIIMMNNNYLSEEEQFKEILNNEEINRITPVIILDEIHMASNKLLEDLGLIFNFSMDSENPFILILAGQPLIRGKLALNVNNPLRQRIVVKHMMSNMQKDELGEYLKTRLAFGGTHEELFTAPSTEAIHGVTSGVPRLVNSLATNCLLYACEKKQRQVDEETVYQAQSELNF
jgi:mRNA-degrading endonuclease HigB of HigAB toxin-antitoxin module